MWSRKKKRFPGLDQKGTTTTWSCKHNRWRVACSASCAGPRRAWSSGCNERDAARGGSIIGKGMWHESSRGPQRGKNDIEAVCARSLLLVRRLLSNRGHSAVKKKKGRGVGNVVPTRIDRCHRGRKRRPVERGRAGWGKWQTGAMSRRLFLDIKRNEVRKEADGKGESRIFIIGRGVVLGTGSVLRACLLV